MKSPSVSCADDRVALARRGALSPAEWQDFATHLAVCVDCRVAWQLGMDFEHSAAARPGDERIVARGVKVALAASARPRANLIRFALAAGVVLIAAGAASAALLVHVAHRGPAASPPTSGQVRPAKSRGAHGMRATVAAEAVPAEAVPAESPAAPAVEVPAAAPAPSYASAPAVATAPALSQVVRAGATARLLQAVAEADPFERAGGLLSPPGPGREAAPALFAQALAERQEGRSQPAIATFRRLQRELPDSREATVSLVSLGDLLLGAGREAEALPCFEAYLHRLPTGTLAPEAWIGKARALDALGRATEARGAWKEIARRFPKSPHPR
jgi:TolA-binding protein